MPIQAPSRFQKWALIILSIATALFFTIGSLIFSSVSIEPNTVKVTCKTISDNSLPASLDHASVTYISDLEYGEYETADRLNQIMEKIRSLNSDLFIFGGDLFSQNTEVDEVSKQAVIQALSSIQAPLGKFAVLGEQDIVTPSRKDLVLSVYKEAQIEVLDNASRLITNKSKDSFHLYGLGLEPNYSVVEATNSSNQFNLLISHYPDNLVSDELNRSHISLALAGNAHGTQITWPILGGYRDWEGSLSFNRAKNNPQVQFKTHLTSGVGCIDVNARLNAPVEIVYLLLTQ